MRESNFDGIRFFEGCPQGAVIKKTVQASISGFITSAQLKNLDDVQRLLASEARKCGCNAIVNFKYGQKSAGLWASIFSRDDVHWYGSGEAATIH